MTDLYVYDGATQAKVATLTVASDGTVTGDPATFGAMATQITGQATRTDVLNTLDGWTNGYLLITSDPEQRWHDTSG